MKRKRVHKAVVEEREGEPWTMATCLTSQKESRAFRWGGYEPAGARERGIDRAVRFLDYNCDARHVHA